MFDKGASSDYNVCYANGGGRVSDGLPGKWAAAVQTGHERLINAVGRRFFLAGQCGFDEHAHLCMESPHDRTIVPQMITTR